jgi:signal transduction histidine kinase
MARVLGNLVSNALRYTEAGGTIALRAYADHRPPTTDHRRKAATISRRSSVVRRRG